MKIKAIIQLVPAFENCFTPDILKYWVGFQQDQSYLMRRCLFNLDHASSDDAKIKIHFSVDD